MHISTSSSDDIVSWASVETDASVVTERADPHPFLSALYRLGMPMSIFGGVFLVLVLVLTQLFSVDRFPVRVGERTVRFADLLKEVHALEDELRTLKNQSADVRGLTPTPVLNTVQSIRSTFMAPGNAIVTIHQLTERAASNGESVQIDQITFNGDDASVTLFGQVIDETRSPAILASFVDALRASEMFSQVSEPEYQVIELSDGQKATPFLLTLIIAS